MDIIIIGGGPAGRSAALELTRLEHKITLIEKKFMGGTCLNEGCMMVNGLLEIARFLDDAENFQKMGIIDINIDFDYKNVADGVKKTLDKLRYVNKKEILDANIELICGEAIPQEGFVTVNGKEIVYEKLIIATGARPFFPNIPGAKNAITYQDILDLEEVPKKLILVGSGVIAAEFAWIFSSLGSEVHILCRGNFLNILDPDISDYVAENLLNKVKIHRQVNVIKITPEGVITSDYEIKGTVLMASGTTPNAEFVGNLVKKGKKGEILVNNQMETSHENIYAAGDVIGGIGSTPISRMEGLVAAHNAVGIPNQVHYDYMPHSISLGYDVAFLGPEDINSNNTSHFKKDKQNVNDKSDFIVNGKIPGSAGPGSFWKVLSSKTGVTQMTVDINSGSVDKLISISPSSRHVMSYISMLLRLNHKLYDFDNFTEPHPSTDDVYKLMRFFSKY
jgi:dihydrolipoamide dehydrogenase